jgi:ABC-type branched-subunit amino acid transport system ATPase component
MKIKTLITKDDHEIDIGKFTVLVGPNNVGKSQTLGDIHFKMAEGVSAKTVLIKDIEFEKPSNFDDLLQGLTVVEDTQYIDHHLIRGINANLRSGDQIRVNLGEFKENFESEPNLNFTLGTISKFRVSYLDASSRLLVAQSAGSYNPHTEPPQNLLQGLFGASPDVGDKLRETFRAAFNMDIILDYSGMTRLTLRVAKDFEDIPEDPRKAYPIISKYDQLDTQGDGFRSFVGVVLSLLLSEGRIVLLDEPEAFLHPAQAKILGNWIAEYSQRVPGQIIIATHNANFLSGILLSSQEVDIYRLNRTGDSTTYNRITPDATSKLAKSPLLSSQRVLEAIFYKGVVVCEADADRCVYQTVSVREFDDQNILFVHAHNKQVIKDVVRLLKEATIPTCTITDIDIINSESDLKKLLEALNDGDVCDSILEMRKKVAMTIEDVSEDDILKKLEENVADLLEQLKENRHQLSGARGALNRIRKEASKWSNVKRLGITGIPEKEQETTEDLIEKAKEYGLFIVPVGELEGWLNLGIRQKNKWIVLALEALHQGKCSSELKDFVKSVLNYLGEDVS